MWFLYRNRKFILFFITLLTIVGICFYFFQTIATDNFLQYKYDLSHKNEPVYTTNQTNKILKEYPIIPFSRLDKSYVNYTQSNTTKYKGMLSNSQYIVIPKSDIYKKIVGEFRIKDFMCKDKYYKDYSETHLNWLIDKKLLYKTHELLETLEEKGFNKNGFYIRSGHRHPTYNEKINGASKSRHIKGQAVDIVIRDINNDGKSNQEDKKIVYDLLNQTIIKNQGGLGRYPGTMVIHYDVRGKRARWDSY